MAYRAQDIMKKRFRSVEADETISRALPLFSGINDALVVLDRDGYAGVLQQEKLLRSGLSPGEARVDTYREHPPVISGNTPLPECARLMIENDVTLLPVVDQGQIAGILDMPSLLSYTAATELGDGKIDAYVAKTRRIPPGTTVAKAREQFRMSRTMILPVIENDDVVGVVSVHDIMKTVLPRKREAPLSFISEKKSIDHLPVSDIMDTQFPVLFESDTVRDAAKKVLSTEAGYIIVMKNLPDSMRMLSGVISGKELLSPLAEQAGSMNAPNINARSEVRGTDLPAIVDMLIGYANRRPGLLLRAMFDVNFKEMKDTSRDRHLIHAALRINTPAGRFLADADGWGEGNALKEALLKIDKQMEKRLSGRQKAKSFDEDEEVVSDKEYIVRDSMKSGIRITEVTETDADRLGLVPEKPVGTESEVNQMEELKISSPAFRENEAIPRKYTCDGDDTNPSLQVGNIPSGAKSLAVIVEDPDAPKGTFTHWIAYNIKPGDSIPESAEPGDQAENSAGEKRYKGPCPPSGPHRYFFRVYALDAMLPDMSGKDTETIKADIQSHAIAQGELMGRYARETGASG